jgi:hypothetical protein
VFAIRHHLHVLEEPRRGQRFEGDPEVPLHYRRRPPTENAGLGNRARGLAAGDGVVDPAPAARGEPIGDYLEGLCFAAGGPPMQDICGWLADRA